MTENFDRWKQLEAAAEAGGGAARRDRHQKAGRLGARARLEAFFDPGTFQEYDRLVTHRATAFGLAERRIPGDGVVTGWGEVDGRPVAAFAQDATVFGGALGEAHAEKIVKTMENARQGRYPDRRLQRLGRGPDPGG
ncbi:Carboxyl transferase domain protein, partial [mine drainage metagenome]